MLRWQARARPNMRRPSAQAQYHADARAAATRAATAQQADQAQRAEASRAAETARARVGAVRVPRRPPARGLKSKLAFALAVKGTMASNAFSTAETADETVRRWAKDLEGNVTER